MPKEITHIILAEQMREKLPRDVGELLHSHAQEYFFGSTAPDLFYYDVPTPFDATPSSEIISETLHGRMGNKNNEHIFWMLDRMKKLDQQDRYFAFIAGYLSHIAADTIFHPMVYSRTGNYFDLDPAERKRSRARHRVLETSLDLYLLSESGRTLRGLGLLRLLRVPEDFSRSLMNLFSLSLSEIYHPDLAVSRGALRSVLKSRLIIAMTLSPIAYKFFSWSNRILSRKHNDLINLFYPPKPAAIDFETSAQIPHPITGNPYPSRIEELRSMATSRGIAYIAAASAYWKGTISDTELRAALPPLSLNSGMQCTTVESMIHYEILPGIEQFDD